MKKQYSVPGFSERLKRAIFETGKTTAEIAAEKGRNKNETPQAKEQATGCI